MSRIHRIDIVAGEQSNHLSEVVRGEIRIDIGDSKKEQAIAEMYRKTDETVYTFLTGEPPPRQPGLTR